MAVSPLAVAYAFVRRVRWAGTYGCGRYRTKVKSAPFRGRPGPHLIHGSLDPHKPSPQRHLNRFSRFCATHPCAQHTNRHTDHATCDICSIRPSLYTACMRCGLIITRNRSPLSLTDPRDAAPRVHTAVHRCDKLVTDGGHQFTTLTVHIS